MLEFFLGQAVCRRNFGRIFLSDAHSPFFFGGVEGVGALLEEAKSLAFLFSFCGKQEYSAHSSSTACGMRGLDVRQAGST